MYGHDLFSFLHFSTFSPFHSFTFPRPAWHWCGETLAVSLGLFTMGTRVVWMLVPTWTNIWANIWTNGFLFLFTMTSKHVGLTKKTKPVGLAFTNMR